MTATTIQFAIVIALLCAGLCGFMASQKNRHVGEAMAIGAFLGVIGVVIVALMKPGDAKTKAGPGQQAVTCPQCGTAQDVSVRSRAFACWNCGGLTQTTL